MTIFDYVLMAMVLYGAGYLLYRSTFKNKSGCSSCSVSGCGLNNYNSNRK